MFASPRKLPRAGSLHGRVVVLDIAFAAVGLGAGFEKTTGKFIDQLGPRLARRWVDHHDHPLHPRFADDPRFVLCTKAEHGACPEMITPELVADTGPIDTICRPLRPRRALLGGEVDPRRSRALSRVPTTTPARWTPASASRAPQRSGSTRPCAPTGSTTPSSAGSCTTSCAGMKPGIERDAIEEAAADFRRMASNARELAREFEVKDGIAYIEVGSSAPPFDKTELLLLGQERAPVAMVVDAGNATIAASFESGLDFVELLEIGGGMPTRVNIPKKRVPAALHTIRDALRKRG